MNSRVRLLLWSLAGAAASALILWWLVAHLQLRWPDLRAAWDGADQPLLLLIGVLSVTWHVLLGAHKLQLVLGRLGVAISLGDAVRLRLGEGPLRMVLPLRGGELLTVLFFWRDRKMPLADAAGALAFDRGLNLLGLSLWLLVGLLLLPDLPALHRLLGAVALVGGGGLLLFVTPLQRLLIRAAEALHGRLGCFVAGFLSPFVRLSPGWKLTLAGYGVLFTMRPLLVCWALFLAHGVVLAAGPTLAYGALSVLAGTLPGPLLGIGPREGAVAMLFAGQVPAGSAVPLAVGLLLSVAVHLLPMTVGLPWAGWFLRRVARKTKRPQ